MDKIMIAIEVDEVSNKIATAIKTNYRKESITDQLKLLGLYQNLVALQQEKIKTLMNLKK